MMNILGKRYIFFGISFLLIIPGLVLIVLNGLPLSIDFLGGSLVEIEFNSQRTPSISEIQSLYESIGINDAQVQTSNEKEKEILFIKSSSLEQNQYTSIVSHLKEHYDEHIVERRFNTVGPSISESVTQRALLAILVSSIAVVLYITFSFRRVDHAFRYGVCAVIAMIHDILIVISLGAIGSQIFGWQMDSLFLTALLTVIGFSTQDKIVVFDRIRENTSLLRKISFEQLVNHSIIQSLQRSINTQLMTVEFLLLSLALFGGETLREMCIILLIGLLSGTYSSIFIAAPILVVWENKEWENWFRNPHNSKV